MEDIEQVIAKSSSQELGDILSWLYQIEYRVRREIKGRHDQAKSFEGYFPDKN